MNVTGVAFLGGGFHTGHVVRMVNFLSASPPNFKRTLLVVGDGGKLPFMPLDGEFHVIKSNPVLPPEGQIRDFIEKSKPSLVAFDCLSAIGKVKDWAADGFYTAIFDDESFAERTAQLGVNAILGDWNKPETAFDNGRMLLQGPDFLVVKSGISEGRQRREFETGLNILISIGGTDPARSTLPILCAFEKLKTENDSGLTGKKISMNVLAGPSHPDIGEIREAASKLGAATGFGIDIGAVLAWADIAITGGGVTAFEAIAAGAALIAVPNPEGHEQLTVSKLVSAGVALSLPAGRTGDFYFSVLKEILSDTKKLEAISLNGGELMDGKGAIRVWNIIGAQLKKAAFASGAVQ